MPVVRGKKRPVRDRRPRGREEHGGREMIILDTLIIALLFFAIGYSLGVSRRP